MTSRREKIAERVFKSLDVVAVTELNKNPGRRIYRGYKKPTQKERRHAGRYTPRIHHSKMKFSEIHLEALEPHIEFDDWDWRVESRRFGSRIYCRCSSCREERKKIREKEKLEAKISKARTRMKKGVLAKGL